MYKRFFQLLFISVILFGCSATPSRESTGEYLDSSAITAKVKAKLVDNLGAKGFAVNVKTYKDEVQLSGFVSSVKLKERAGVIAATIPSVSRVRNDLIVK